MINNHYVSGVAAFFKDENALLDAAKKTHAAGFRKFDSLSPFPIHGMDDAIGLEPSKLPWVTFVMGLIGLTLGTLFTWYVHAYDWPIIIGGKPHFSLPAFVPIIFEVTVFFAAHCSVIATLIMCGLPKIDPPIIDPDITSHKFALFVPSSEASYDPSKVETFFKSIGGTEIRRVEKF